MIAEIPQGQMRKGLSRHGGVSRYHRLELRVLCAKSSAQSLETGAKGVGLFEHGDLAGGHLFEERGFDNLDEHCRGYLESFHQCPNLPDIQFALATEDFGDNALGTDFWKF